MNHPAARKKHMGVGLFVLVLLSGLFLVGLTGCSGGERYQVDYCGSKDCYSNAKDSYRAGTEVTLYFELVATDTDYSFRLDGEPVNYTYDDTKGFVIQFTMPNHDVKLECNTKNSMLPFPDDGWNDFGYEDGSGSMGLGNPLVEITLDELAEEAGCVLTLPEDIFHDLSVMRIDGDPPLYSLDYCFSGDWNYYTLRLQMDPAAGDISGMYYDWTERETTEDYVLYCNGEGQGLILWQDEQASFSIAMEEHASREALLSMRTCMMESLKYN